MNTKALPGKIFLMLLAVASLAVPRQAEALLASHECSFCHDFHGAPSVSGLLKYSSSEVLCLTCHSTINGTTNAAAPHNPLNLASDQLGYITCRECHNPHDNKGGNVKLVGFTYDPEYNQSFSLPKIRVELPTSDPANPVYKTVRFASMADFNVADVAVNGACEICHSGYHNAGEDCTGCHGHDGEFAPTAGTCTDCHTGSGGGAKNVGSSSPHVKVGKASGYDAFVDCTECHSGHADGVTGVNDVEISTASAPFNNKYSAHAGGRIQLGGARTSGSYEAEICWNCHQNDTYQGAADISEWDGSHATYDYGSVTAGNLNWLTTNWSSARSEFAYKNGRLSNKPTVANPSVGTTNGGSTHGIMGGAAGVDAIGNIGCSACHDVHDTGGGINNAAGPYLRGSWQSNPYREDGAPRSGAGQTINGGWFGAVPRGDLANNFGGYQIDQNNTGITVLTATDGAGLCELCHGNGGSDGIWSSAEIGAIGGSAAWVSTGNSHSYVVKGGLTSGGFNLYNEAIRLPNSGFAMTGTAGGNAGNPAMAYKNHNAGVAGYGFRGTDGRSFVDTPGMTGAGRPYGHDRYDANGWGATVNASTVDGAYHQFSCSKCHNPHASRLPKLMITNCLDTKLNTWDNTLTVPAQGTANGQGTDTVSVENGGVSYSNSTSAQNCHRLKDPAFNNAGGNGWNTASPW